MNVSSESQAEFCRVVMIESKDENHCVSTSELWPRLHPDETSKCVRAAPAVNNWTRSSWQALGKGNCARSLPTKETLSRAGNAVHFDISERIHFSRSRLLRSRKMVVTCWRGTKQRISNDARRRCKFFNDKVWPRKRPNCSFNPRSEFKKKSTFSLSNVLLKHPANPSSFKSQ